MNPQIVVRSEAKKDIDAIAEVTIAAFRTLAISNHTEQFIIDALRNAGALTVSLIAEVGGRVVGHLACHHFGRHTGLVRPWTCCGLAGMPASGHWQSPDP